MLPTRFAGLRVVERADAVTMCLGMQGIGGEGKRHR